MNRGPDPASWFYTAPMEDVAVRRGDPLGLQGVAENIAETLVPGLSNRTVDARWISILCWCLRQGHGAWRAYGAGHGEPALGKHLYPWVRPLELLWVARTAEQTEEGGRGRQLPGIRPVRNWIQSNRRPGNFAFAATAYEQYRFTGSYGGYRAALRSLGGMTDGGGGWLLGEQGRKLAEIAARHVECPNAFTRRSGATPSPERLWTDAVRWKRSSAGFLPTLLRRADALDADERAILKQALFTEPSDDAVQAQARARRRRMVALAVAGSSASVRADLMADVAKALRGEPNLPWLPNLPGFSALADAGTGAMNACWQAVSQARDQVLTVADVAHAPTMHDALKELVQASRKWQSRRAFTSWEQAGRLADTVLSAKQQPAALLRRLIGYHVQYGGGLRWVALDGDMVRPIARLREADASLYKYRLPALARLAAQCGVTRRIPDLLRDETEAETAGAGA